MRVWLQPDKMARLGVTHRRRRRPRCARRTRSTPPARSAPSPRRPGQSIVYTVTARGRLVEPEEFGEIVVRASGPSGVLRIEGRRARRARRAELRHLDHASTASPPIGMAVFLQTGANALEVADRGQDSAWPS